MKAVIIYDSLYGNTQQIAQALSEGLTGNVTVARVGDVRASELPTCDLLIVGSPVHNGRATSAINTLLQQLPAHALEGMRVAAFDTRFELEAQGIGVRLVMQMLHYAAERIAKALEKKGGDWSPSLKGSLWSRKKGR